MNTSSWWTAATAYQRWWLRHSPYRGLSCVHQDGRATYEWHRHLDQWSERWFMLVLNGLVLGLFGVGAVVLAALQAWGSMTFTLALVGFAGLFFYAHLIDLRHIRREIQWDALYLALQHGTLSEVQQRWDQRDAWPSIGYLVEHLHLIPNDREATYPWAELVRWLIAQGADLNAKDMHGMPVVLRMHRNLSLSAQLLAQGAVVTYGRSCPTGEPDAQRAAFASLSNRVLLELEWEHKHYLEAVRRGATEAKTETTQWQAVQAHYLALVDLWLAHGWVMEQHRYMCGDLTTRPERVETLLTGSYQWEEFAIGLLARGADPFARNGQGQCLLDLLRQYKHRAFALAAHATCPPSPHHEPDHEPAERLERWERAIEREMTRRLGFTEAPVPAKASLAPQRPRL